MNFCAFTRKAESGNAPNVFPLSVFWTVWGERNRLAFEGLESQVSVLQVVGKGRYAFCIGSSVRGIKVLSASSILSHVHDLYVQSHTLCA